MGAILIYESAGTLSKRGYREQALSGSCHFKCFIHFFYKMQQRIPSIAFDGR